MISCSAHDAVRLHETTAKSLPSELNALSAGPIKSPPTLPLLFQISFGLCSLAARLLNQVVGFLVSGQSLMSGTLSFS